nr:unnamed protein product [Callosobruchus analis]
MILLTSWE